MPWLLYRYLLGELLRVFALCASVLVLVIAFGAAIKPLAGDDLIGPLQTAKYIMLAAVPMLGQRSSPSPATTSSVRSRRPSTSCWPPCPCSSSRCRSPRASRPRWCCTG
ncbi:MAG: hypothetical protein ACYTGF_06770 [Planctomycetota bacterium]